MESNCSFYCRFVIFALYSHLTYGVGICSYSLTSSISVSHVLKLSQFL